MLTTSVVTPPRLRPGTLVGRFVVQDEIGAGGMGRVCRALDPELERTVALKLIRRSSGDAEARAVREAQALARVDHPNVVSIYDVGYHDGHIYLAMELVEGRTLRDWLHDEERGWQETLEQFVQAGHGLQAVHAAGLAHRDFKPTNVLVGSDGRIRVLDLGLARGLGASSEEGTWDDPRRSAQIASSTLTEAGMVLGTPPYMAPEQHRGEAADARSDQYAFCVALYEGLYGKRPFSASTMTELLRAKLAASASTVPRLDRAVPTRIHDALVRGLAPAPEERWPDMRSLLAVLGRGDHRRPLLRTAVACSVAVAILYAIPHGSEPCEGWPAPTLWSDEQRATSQASFLATGLSYAAGSWKRVEPQISDYVRRFDAAYARVCDAEVPGGGSDVLRDATTSCLRVRQQEVSSLIDSFEAADEQIVRNAVRAASSLPDIEACIDPTFVSPRVASRGDPSTAARGHALRLEMAAIRAQRLQGREADLVALAKTLLGRATEIGDAALKAEIEFQLGNMLKEQGAFEESEDLLRSAYFGAHGAGLNGVAASAAVQLVFVVGVGLARHDAGLEWGNHARAAMGPDGTLEQLSGLYNHEGIVHFEAGDPSAGLQRLQWAALTAVGRSTSGVLDLARYLENLSSAHYLMGSYDVGLAYARSALEIETDALGEGHPSTANAVHTLALLELELGRPEEALELLNRELSIREVLAPDHPATASVHGALGNVYERMGRLSDALAQYERNYAMLVERNGPNYPAAVTALQNVGNVHYRLGEHERALELQQRVHTFRIENLGPDHPEVGDSLNNVGIIYGELGDWTKALQHYDRALAILEAAWGPQHPRVAIVVDNRGQARRNLGDLEGALEDHRRALQIFEASSGSEEPGIISALEGLGKTLMALERGEEATEVLERAVALALVQGNSLPPSRAARLKAALHEAKQAGRRQATRRAVPS